MSALSLDAPKSECFVSSILNSSFIPEKYLSFLSRSYLVLYSLIFKKFGLSPYTLFVDR